MEKKIHMRWMTGTDLPEVMLIEESVFEFSWKVGVFVHFLRKRNAVSLVILIDDRIVGYMVYQYYKHHLEIMNFTVASGDMYRRKGIGKAAIDILKSKTKRHRIEVYVVDDNLSAHLFFKAMGFKAERIAKDHYVDPVMDAYVFAHQKENQKFIPRNRIDWSISHASDV